MFFTTYWFLVQGDDPTLIVRRQRIGYREIYLETLVIGLAQGSATFINQRAIFGPKKRTKTVQEPHNIFEAYNEGSTAYLLSLN